MSATALAKKAKKRVSAAAPASGSAHAQSDTAQTSISHVMALEASVDVLRERLQRAKDERKDAVKIVQQLTLKLKEIAEERDAERK